MNALRNTLGSILSIIFLSAVGLSTTAKASILSEPEFEVTESRAPGVSSDYTVINNSGEAGHLAEYIYGFLVSNPLASSAGDWTTDKGWKAGKLSTSEYGNAEFAYVTTPGTEGHGPLGRPKFNVNPETIRPGEQESGFFFGTSLLLDGTVTLLLVDAKGQFSTYTTSLFATSSTTPAVPEPSTWAMMILGFAGLGLLGFRRKQRTPVAAA
jgi:hypothetical protein